MCSPKTCRCNCGPSCGENCGLPLLDCIEKHWRRDCDHDFVGWVKTERGGSRVCSRCGMTAMKHDMQVGP